MTKKTDPAVNEDGACHASRFVSIKKVDEYQQIIYGEVYAPFVLDTYGEFMTANDIEIMAHRFLKLDLTQVIDTQHDNIPNGSYPVETFIAREGDPDFTPGAWVLGVKVSDNLWPAVKSGEYNGFSFQSIVTPVEVEIVYSVIRDHVGETEAHQEHTHKYFIEVNVDGQVVGGRTDEVNGHSHVIRRASVTEKSDEHTHRFFL